MEALERQDAAAHHTSAASATSEPGEQQQQVALSIDVGHAENLYSTDGIHGPPPEAADQNVKTLPYSGAGNVSNATPPPDKVEVVAWGDSPAPTSEQPACLSNNSVMVVKRKYDVQDKWGSAGLDLDDEYTSVCKVRSLAVCCATDRLECAVCSRSALDT